MYIAIDVGGTTTRVASFESTSAPDSKNRLEFPTPSAYEEGVKKIVETVRTVFSGKVAGVGICIASPLNSAKTALQKPPNLNAWEGKPFKNDLEKELKCRVELENDGAAAALAEATYANPSRKDFLFLIWGTGIGGAFVSYTDGKAHIVSSERGHVNIAPGGWLCGCGKKGCMEAYCGGGNIKKYYDKPAEMLSEAEWREVEEHFTQGLTKILIENPTDTVIFSGSIALRQPKRLLAIQAIVRKNLQNKMSPALTVSTFGDDSGLLGALSLLRDSP